MRRTRIVIQSRLSSSRLPGKAMLTIAGMPLVELVARRASRSGHEVVVATSDEQYDSRIAEHLRSVGIAVVRGPLDDVLLRFVGATQDLAADDRVVRLTGDNPVADADLVDELLAAMDVSAHTYGRVDIERVPEGLGAEAFTAGALRAAQQAATAAYDREHVTPWLRRELGELLFVPRDAPADIHAYRCTVDSLADYDRVSQTFAACPDPVGVPWRELTEAIGTRVYAGGPMAPRRGRRPQQSALVLGGAQLVGAARPAADVRALLAYAVDHGVSHCDLGRADGETEQVFRACSEPALKQRIDVVSRQAPLGSGRAPLEVADAASPALLRALAEAGFERTFANLGRRRVDCAVFDRASDATACGGTAWEYALERQQAGEIGRLGVVARTPAELALAERLPELACLEIPFSIADRRWAAPTSEQALLRLADGGVEILVFGVLAGGLLTGARAPDEGLAQEVGTLRDAAAAAASELGREDVADLCLAYALAQPWVSAAIIGCDSIAQLRANIEASARAPLTGAQAARASEVVPAGSLALCDRGRQPALAARDVGDAGPPA